MKDPKGKRVATWEPSNKDDREVSPPLGFPPHTKLRLMTDQTDKGKGKEEEIMWNAVESNAIPHSTTGEKSRSIPLPFLPEEIPGNERGAPSLIPPNPKEKEKITPITVIKNLTQKFAKQTVDLHSNFPFSNNVINIPIVTPDTLAGTANIPEFDKILNTLGKVFPQPSAASVALLSLVLCNDFGSLNPKMDLILARERLSSLLPIDYNILIDAPKLIEVVTLSNMLQNDTTLSANQLAMLKLIVEIPLLSKDIIEIKELAGQVENFFVSVASEFFKATTLWKEYSKSMEKIKSLQAEVEVDVVALKEFGDDQSIILNARHSVLVCSVEMKKNMIMELESSVKEIGNQIYMVSDYIKADIARKQDWGVNRKMLTDRCRKILDKFALLEDFTI